MYRRNITVFGIVCIILVAIAVAGLSPLTGLASTTEALLSDTSDVGPDVNVSHRVEIDGVVDTNLKVDLDTIRVETAVIEIRDGTSLVVQKRPGETTYYDFTLLCGVDGPCTFLLAWYDDIRNQQPVRKTVTIFLRSTVTGSDSAQWEFLNCWPSRLQGIGTQAPYPQFLWAITCEQAHFTYL